MEYTKEDLRKKFNEVIEQIEEKGFIGVEDARKMANYGVPIIDICRDKCVFDAIRISFEKWLNRL